MRYFIIFEEFDEATRVSKKHKIEVSKPDFNETVAKFPAVSPGFK